MSKQLTEAQIKQRKKIQAYTSIAGGTLGLTALGLRGGSVATAGGRTGRFLRVKARPALSTKLKDYSTAATTAGAGLGGASAFNFAAYTKAEANKNKRRVQKNYDGGIMDFGLGQVRQGTRIEEVSKAAYLPKHAMPKVSLSKPFHGAVKQPVNAKGMQGTMKTGIKTPFNNPSQKFTPVTQMLGKKPPTQTLQKGSLTPLGKGTVGGVGLAGAGAVGYNSGQKQQKKQMMRGISKALTPIGTARKTMPPTAQGTPNLGAARSPNAVAALSAAPGQAQRALVQQRNKNIPMVAKAYDPERNRQKRLDRYANVTNFGAGALGSGAVYHSAGAVSLARKGRAAETGKWLNAAGKAKKANAKAALGYYKSAGRAGGRATAFALGAGGAAVAADRIRRYKKGRGAKYSPLRLTEY